MGGGWCALVAQEQKKPCKPMFTGQARERGDMRECMGPCLAVCAHHRCIMCRLCWCVARVVKSEKIPVNRRLQGVEGGVGVVWG